jgi:hypothetical protein
MRRLLILGVVLLLAGLALNVGVAWACALWSPGQTPAPLRSDDLALFPPNVPAYSIFAPRSTSFGFADTDIEITPLGSIPVLGQGDHYVRSGWPAHALAGHWSYPNHLESGLKPPPWTHPQTAFGWSRFLPLRPLWPGFCVDTLVFTVSLAILLAPRPMRRQFRLVRHRCVTCGYPAGGSGICSECGSIVPTRVA